MALARRGDRPAPAADPLQHGEPAGQRAARAGDAARTSSRPPGFECELLGATRGAAEPGRAPAGAQATGTRLCYLSHVDTVLAEPAEWSVDPWSGEIRDGYRLGSRRARHEGPGRVRGRRGVQPRALGLAAGARRAARVVTCDEEAGATYGAQWLCDNVPEKVRCDMVVNEGAGEVLEFDGRRLYTLCIGEKGVFRFKLIDRGPRGARLDAGHRRQRAAAHGRGAVAPRRAPAAVRPLSGGRRSLEALTGERGRRRRRRAGARARAPSPGSRTSSSR